MENLKNCLLRLLSDYEIIIKEYPEGDFGSLLQIEFNNQYKGGNFDIWDSGRLGIFVWDYKNKIELINILLEPNYNLSDTLSEINSVV